MFKRKYSGVETEFSFTLVNMVKNPLHDTALTGHTGHIGITTNMDPQESRETLLADATKSVLLKISGEFGVTLDQVSLTVTKARYW